MGTTLTGRNSVADYRLRLRGVLLDVDAASRDGSFLLFRRRCRVYRFINGRRVCARYGAALRRLCRAGKPWGWWCLIAGHGW
jgi:hypothetical protein